MSKPKAIASVIQQMFGAQTSLVDLFNGPDLERFPSGGGWAVTVTRGRRDPRNWWRYDLESDFARKGSDP